MRTDLDPLVDHHILLALGVRAVYFLVGYEKLSLNPRWRETGLVNRFPILE